jgi:hypothetical protein
MLESYLADHRVPTRGSRIGKKEVEGRRIMMLRGGGGEREKGGEGDWDFWGSCG